MENQKINVPNHRPVMEHCLIGCYYFILRVYYSILEPVDDLETIVDDHNNFLKI